MELGRTKRIFIALVVISCLVLVVVTPGAILLALGRQKLLASLGTVPALIIEEALFTTIIAASVFAILNVIANPDLPRLSALLAGAFRGAVIGGMFGVLHALLRGLLYQFFESDTARVLAGAVTGLAAGGVVELVQRLLKWDDDGRQRPFATRLLMWAALGAWMGR
jgi:hypothetical protein